MLVSNNILLNNGFVMPCSMNIDEYYISILDNVDTTERGGGESVVTELKQLCLF
jgi:hypothetical protein